MIPTSEKMVWRLKHEVMTEMARDGLLDYGESILDEPTEIVARGEQVHEVIDRIHVRTGIPQQRIAKILRVYYGEQNRDTLFAQNLDCSRTFEGLLWPQRGEVGIPGIHHINRKIDFRGEWC